MTLDEPLIARIGLYEGKSVTLRGWLYHKRDLTKLVFLQLRDGTGIIQCVVGQKDVPPEVFEKAQKAGQESSLSITGKVSADPRSPIGYELHVTNIEIHQLVTDYPIGPKEHGTGFLMEHRHLWLRSSRQWAIARVRSELIKAIRDYFDWKHFTLVDAPILTGAACEGTTTLFKIDYFGEPAYLSQSGQLYGEAAAMALGRVYCFGPTFRAEKSKTRRHLMEFWMVEPEVAYLDLAGDMEMAEDFVSYLLNRVVGERRKELEVLERDIGKLERAAHRPYPKLHYDEAVELLRKKTGKDRPWGDDFGAEEETLLASEHDTPVFVHRFPSACKAFYMKRDPSSEKHSLSMDLLAPEGYGEIVGGGQREDDYETLRKRLAEHNIPEESMRWYLDLRKYGSVPHAGFGLGIERTLAWICGIPHVRETIAFPRMLEKIWP
ncbi:MAG: asparagine--tRNA ligase [Bdellovibrionota bacterium]